MPSLERRIRSGPEGDRQIMEQRNLIMAIVLSVSILLGFQIFIEAPQSKKNAPRWRKKRRK